MFQELEKEVILNSIKIEFVRRKARKQICLPALVVNVLALIPDKYFSNA